MPEDMRFLQLGIRDPPTKKLPLRSCALRPSGSIAIAARHGAFVSADHFMRSTRHANLSAIHPDDSMAQPPHLVHLVADQDHRPSLSGHIAHFPQAFLLE